MSTTRRIIIAIVIIAVLAGAILAIESTRRGGYLYRSRDNGQKEYSEGCVPVSSGGKVIGSFCRKESAGLGKTSFRDGEENKVQEGWLLGDVLKLYVKKEEMSMDTIVRVESTARGKKAEVSWRDISDRRNNIILALSKQGNLKLVSTMKGLDTRERWVQDVDRIEVLRR